MAFASAAISPAFLAIAINAGSAIVVENPIANPKISSHQIFPLAENWKAIFSPSGNKPISRPCIKRNKPTNTKINPEIVAARSGKGCLITKS